jgi:hypothetical protein
MAINMIIQKLIMFRINSLLKLYVLYTDHFFKHRLNIFVQNMDVRNVLEETQLKKNFLVGQKKFMETFMIIVRWILLI